MKFSPTTFLGYVQSFGVACILGKPLYYYFAVKDYDAVQGLAIASALSVAFVSAIATVKGHFTADNPPNPKSND